MDKEIKIKVPATIANIVCGFDVLGMAVNDPFDEVTVRKRQKPGIVIQHLDDYGLPEVPEKNVAGVALQTMLRAMNDPCGFEILIKKNIMPGSGLGSSAASSVAAVAAANELLGQPFSRSDLLQFAKEGEFLASGSAHFDNIAPCLYGGITLIQSISPLHVVNLAHPNLCCTIIHPQIEVKTSDSRRIIKQEIPLRSAIRQWSNIAGLVAGFCQNDYALIGKSLEDVIFEPVRSMLIPAFDEMKAKCLEAGALGGGISGSGPSVFMLSRDEKTAYRIERTMSAIYEQVALPYKCYVTTIKTTPLL